ncbi:MAG: sulfatase-like hydrolase/transferase [Rikenellaceae bacterium]
MKKYLLLGGAAAVITSVAAQSKAPNILLILADDMRGSAVGMLGEEAVLTPNIDRLAEDATTLSRTYIMGGTSGAVSMPSRAMIMSGKYLHTLSKNGGTIPVEHATIGETLQSCGYTAFHTGKWHNGGEAYNRSFNEGTAIYFGGMADHWNVPLHDRKESGNYIYKNRPVVLTPMGNNIVTYEKGDYALSGKHSVDIFTDTALEYLDDNAGGDKPFFLSVSYMLPHDPRNTHQRFLDLYNVDDIKLPDSFVGEHPFDNGELRIRDEKLLPFPRTEEATREQIRDYYACISHMDEGCGRLIERLKELGVYDNTIIIFAADNGLAVGQHGLLGKQNMYEHSIRVPLMIKGAEGSSVPKGVVRDEPCLMIDIFPTLCQLVDVETPKTVDGVSLMPIIESEKRTRDYLYHGYVFKQRAVSDGEWKLIEYFVKDKHTTQLFNLKDDPKEMNDLSKEKKYAKRVAQLRKQMKEEAALTHDPAEWVMEL